MVWHGVPRDMVGETLFPLGQLRAIYPDRYQVQAAKYAGRESVLDFRVPILDVPFNDTVHCSSVHPHRLFAARQRLGLNPRARPEPPKITGLFFEIPLERIVVHPVLWYSVRTLWINGAPGEDLPLVPPQDEFESFDASRYTPLPDVTPLHVDYLRRMKQRGRPPLMFVHIPHVLVAGPIDVRGCPIVGWDEPPAKEAARPRAAPGPGNQPAGPDADLLGRPPRPRAFVCPAGAAALRRGRRAAADGGAGGPHRGPLHAGGGHPRREL